VIETGTNVDRVIMWDLMVVAWLLKRQTVMTGWLMRVVQIVRYLMMMSTSAGCVTDDRKMVLCT